MNWCNRTALHNSLISSSERSCWSTPYYLRSAPRWQRTNWEIVFYWQPDQKVLVQLGTADHIETHLIPLVVAAAACFTAKRLIVLVAQHTPKSHNCVWFKVCPPPLHVLLCSLCNITLRLDGVTLLSVMAHVVEWKRLHPPPVRAQGKCGDKPSRERKEREREGGSGSRDRWDYYPGCDGAIYTCGISNLALSRHLISQGSLASSSPWRSPATGSKMSFSSCRPSTTGNDWPPVNNAVFLERIGRGSCLCLVPLHSPSLH